VLSHNTVKKNC